MWYVVVRPRSRCGGDCYGWFVGIVVGSGDIDIGCFVHILLTYVVMFLLWYHYYYTLLVLGGVVWCGAAVRVGTSSTTVGVGVVVRVVVGGVSIL